MNWAAQRWVGSTDCRVKGSARAVLYAIAHHADRDTGECWIGQRRLAEVSGLSRATVQRALNELFGDGVLEFIEDHQGPKPERFQIAPGLIEGEASASGIVEGESTASDVIEHQAVAGEVIHNPPSSGLTASPLEPGGNFLVDSSRPASGLTRGLEHRSVDSSSVASGLTASQANNALTSTKSDMPVAQDLKQVSLKAREVQVVENDDSTADAVVVLDAYEPPPVDDAYKRWLIDRGLGRKLQATPTPKPKPDWQPMARDEQLAYLRAHMTPEEQERLERGQTRPADVEAPAGVAEGNGQALDATVAIAAHAQPAVVNFGAVVHAAGAVEGTMEVAGQTEGCRVEQDADVQVVVTDRVRLVG